MADAETRNFKYHIPEVTVFLIFFGTMISDSVNSNFIIYRTCYALLHFDEAECAKLGTKFADNSTEELEKKVEPYANLISMILVWPAQIVPALLCLFVGPWSDKNGRKPVLISALLGLTISSLCQVGIALIPSLSPWYAIIPSILSVIFGGFSPMLMLILCYITDITTPENRGMRLGIFEAVFGFATLLGTFSSSYLFDALGYVSVFGISCSSFFLALLYVIFVLPETVNTRNNTQSTREIVSISNIKEMFSVLIKRRMHHLRAIIFLSMFILALYIMASADGNMFYYLRAKFHWDLQKFTTFKSIRDLTSVVGTFLGLLILHKWLKFHETTIVLLSFLLLCNSSIVQALAEKDWQIILAACLRIISGTVSPMVRSFLSKLVSHDDIGKIFSTSVALETLAMIAGAPIFTLIYNNTLNYFPGAYNLFAASIYLVEIILIITVIVLKNKYLSRTSTYEVLVDTVEE